MFDGSNPGLLQTSPIWNTPNSLFPGTTTNPGLTGNTVNVTGGTIGGNVLGGITPDTSPGQDVNTNTVTVDRAAEVSGDVYGGASNSGSVWGNTATVNGNAQVTGWVYGGWSRDGSVYNNQATVSGGRTASVIGGDSIFGDVYNNTVTVIGNAQVDTSIAGGISGFGNAHDNTVTISGTAQVNEDVFGGISLFSSTANNNTVIVSGGTVGSNVYGGYISSGSGNAHDNNVKVSSGSVSGNVLGGISDSGNAYNNTVTISGGTLGGWVTGGRSASGNATYNSIFLSGNPTFNHLATNIQGGLGTGGSDYFSGNTLTVLNPISSPVRIISNFQYYRFILPTTAAGSVTPMLTADYISLSDGGSRTATVDRLVITRGGSLPTVGDRYVLLGSANPIIGSYTANRLTAMKGVSLLYDMDVAQNTPNTLTATVASARANPQTKALSEGRISGLGFVNQGADLVAGQGMASMLTAMGTEGGAGSVAGFGAMGGSTSRYDTGSHTDVDGFSLMTGLGWSAPLLQNSLLLGVFFEAGWGNYDSHNSFSNAASVRGKGDTKYYGGGILARYDLTEGSLAGLYAEASLRAGHTSTDFSSRNLQDFPGPVYSSYDSGSSYYGAHTGLGYIWNIMDKTSLDFFTKYLWTHQSSDNVTVAGDPIHFKAADSRRWRNGIRLNHAMSLESGAQLTPYIGVAYDHEFDGKAKATTTASTCPPWT